MRLLLAILVGVALAGAQSASYKRGLELLERREFAKAGAELEAAVKAEPRSAEAHHALGLARLAQGNITEALKDFRTALRLKPAFPEAHLARGLALGQSGELQAAATEFRAALRLRGGYAEAHKRLGITLRRMDDPKGALAEFEATVAADAKDPEGWYHLGLARKSGGDMSGAIEAFRRAVALKPDFEKATYNLSIALGAQGRREEADRKLKELEGLHRFRAKLAVSKALIVRGVEALQKGEHDQALQLFEQASTETPQLATSWHYLGVAWERKGDSQKALAAWRKALDLEPDYPQTHSSLGLMFARREDCEAAAAEFRKALMSDPDDAQAHYNLGLCLQRRNRLDEALAEFTESVALQPDYTDARMQMALTLSAKGGPEAAASVYRELLRRSPNLAEAHNNLGLALLELGDYRGAEAAFHQALVLRPAFAPARQNLELTKPCEVAHPAASLTIPRARAAAELSADPDSPLWSGAATATIVMDCTHRRDYPGLSTQVRGFWTDSDLYLLFICPYTSLNVFLPPQNDAPRDKLWDRDVVEMFLGADWDEIRRYREFEIAPTGDWIDLAIDLRRKSYDQGWRSGWRTAARMDEKAHVWYAAARIPLRSVSSEPVRAGTRWRMNLYRIEGQGPDERRHFLCWQPTCVVNRDPNHVPEAFGSLVFGK